MFSLINSLSQRSREAIVTGLSVAIATTPACISLLVVSSESFSVDARNHTLDFQSKSKEVVSTNEIKLDKLQSQFDDLYDSYQDLINVVEANQDGRVLQTKIEKVDREFALSGARLDDVEESQKNLEELTESVN